MTSCNDGSTKRSWICRADTGFLGLRQCRSIRSACLLCCMSSMSSPFTLSKVTSISFMLSIWSESSCLDSISVCLSCSRASWHASLISSCGGRASLSWRRRSQTLSGAHFDRCALWSWKRHSPTCLMVSSTLSTRSSRAFIRSSVPTIFFLMVWLTTAVLACSCLFACPRTLSVSMRLLRACFWSAFAWFRPSRVFCSHLSLVPPTGCFNIGSCGGMLDILLLPPMVSPKGGGVLSMFPAPLSWWW
mmetsp:Transcript_3378/g.7760  ORF Transcript_3378/g.7760 Transcript_3378/m.7760 type:complete len:246 (-) Transcript_3378:280-1017(-)